MPILDDMLEQKIENISVVFCLIDDKDIFKKYYSKFLAKRLIKGKLTTCIDVSCSSRHAMIWCLSFMCCFSASFLLFCIGTSVSNDMEILLIQKLRDICGCDFVSKLQKMLKDKMLSTVLASYFFLA